MNRFEDTVLLMLSIIDDRLKYIEKEIKRLIPEYEIQKQKIDSHNLVFGKKEEETEFEKEE